MNVKIQIEKTCFLTLSNFITSNREIPVSHFLELNGFECANNTETLYNLD